MWTKTLTTWTKANDILAAFLKIAKRQTRDVGEIVDEFLIASYKEGMTAEHLLTTYKTYGEDPWISSADDDCTFSARDYAQDRCEEIGRRE